MVDPFTDRTRQDPYPTYERLRRTAPVFHDRRRDVWLVSRYDDASRILNDPVGFSNRKTSAEPTLLGADAASHARIRSVVKDAFTVARIRALDQAIKSLADRLISRVAQQHHCEVVEDIAAPLPPTVVAWMLGIDPARSHDIRRWSAGILQRGARRSRRRGSDEVSECRNFLMDHFRRARREPSGGWVTDLLVSRIDSDRLTLKEMTDIGLLLIVAGTETTTNLIGNAAAHIEGNLAWQRRFRDDAKALASFIEEVLRYDSPVQRRPRLTNAPATIGEAELPANARVEILIGSANRDEAKFPEADRFDPARRPNQHLAFGTGPHFCLGAYLARVEAFAALQAMLNRLPNMVRAAPHQPLQYVDSLNVRGPQRLDLVF